MRGPQMPATQQSLGGLWKRFLGQLDPVGLGGAWGVSCQVQGDAGAAPPGTPHIRGTCPWVPGSSGHPRKAGLDTGCPA